MLDAWVGELAASSGIQALAQFLQRRQLLPSDDENNNKALVYFLLSVYTLLLGLFVAYRLQRRQRLKRELRQARAELDYLRDKLSQLGGDGSSNGNGKHSKPREIRIFMDGAFDLMHYGHMNAFRLGRSLGTHLVVGLNSDESIQSCKGQAPLLNDEERLRMVAACKFVDEVVPGVPYIMNRDYLDYVIDKYKIDYVIHGDDPCLVDGKDVYATAKAAGKYRSIPRTEGVSTTDIVGRMLLLTKEHHFQNGMGQRSKFLTTSRMMRLFSGNVPAPEPGMRVIYVDGAWDLFHPGHVSILQAARARGDYLIVGIHGDAVVNQERGMNLPLMNLHERVLSVLGCRHVDDVLMDAPYEVTADMLASLQITEVVHVVHNDNNNSNDENETTLARLQVAQDRGMLHRMERTSDFNMGSILQRIQRNQDAFQSRFDRKTAAEEKFYQEKRQTNGSNGVTSH
jgi:ethanolamine-phosphate cytidylyltransferase